ncbi:MAG: iron-sulfur cluster repair protein YtfE [Planctomycetota bacterium]
MNSTTQPITPQTTLADLAATRAGASRVFYRHDLDFCCHGRISLAEACTKKGLAVDELVRAIEAEAPREPDFQRWDAAPIEDLITHLLERFHASHRAELPRLLEMAQKVERVHADKPSCPRGLAAHVERMGEELESHMQKEEQVLFPMILSGRGRMASMPIQVMEEEHDDHGRNLERLRELAHGFTPPAEACGTWRALYLGLAELDSVLRQHIHLENNVLFPRALRG